MKLILFVFSVFCFSSVVGQQKSVVKKDSTTSIFSEKIVINKPNFNPFFFKNSSTSSEAEINKQNLNINNFQFNKSTSDIFSSAPKTVYNPYGTTNKGTTIFNGSVALLKQILNKK